MSNLVAANGGGNSEVSSLLHRMSARVEGKKGAEAAVAAADSLAAARSRVRVQAGEGKGRGRRRGLQLGSAGLSCGSTLSLGSRESYHDWALICDRIDIVLLFVFLFSHLSMALIFFLPQIRT